MKINKHDTDGIKPLLGKGELGYDDYTAGGDTGRVYVGTGTENIALAERLESNMMTKAQFNALAEERKANRAGSGFDEWGKHLNNGSSIINVNDGMFVVYNSANANTVYLGESPGVGTSKTVNPIININGTRQSIAYINVGSSSNKIILPTAPNIYPHDAVLTAEQIASGVIKHADASNSGLIVNGKFDTDTSGWTAYASTLSVDSGRLKITSVNTQGGRVRQVIDTIVGKKYRVDSVQENGTSPNLLYVVPNETFSNAGALLITESYGEFIATTNKTSILIMNNYTDAVFSYVDKIAVYPADAISRSDLVFLESWHEDISEKNFVYPLGNTQYLGGNTDGLTGIANGAFTGFETYSLFGNWQTPSALIGKGYVWSSLTEAQKRAFIANPENNCYLDGDKTIQVRYRVRVVQGMTDVFANVSDTLLTFNAYSGFSIYPKGKYTYTQEYGGTLYASLKFGPSNLGQSQIGAFVAIQNDIANSSMGYAQTKCCALPIALVSRRNQGMYHNVYNPNGTKLASDGLDCFRTTVSFTSISDCFDPAKLLTASGYIGTVSGRPDGLLYDQVHESDITDLRNSSKKVEDYNRLINREFNKLVTGSTRGKEKEPFTESKLQTTTGTVATIEVKDGTAYESGSVIQVFDLTAGVVKGRFTVKSVSGNTLTVDTSFTKLANVYVIGGGKR